MKYLLLSFEVIPVDGNAPLGTFVQFLETACVLVFRDGLQLGRHVMLDVRNVRKPVSLQG